MKFSCTQNNLKTGLLNVAHVAGKNINLPILNNILIDASDSLIKLICTDLEIGVTSTIRGKIEKTGRATVNAKLLSDYISLLPNQRVDIELEDDFLKVNCEKFKTKIKNEDVNDYPIIPSVEKNKYFTFDFAEFKKVVSGVVFAASNNETRIELSGVYFEFSENELVLAATDSYRLIERKIKYTEKNNISEIKKVIVPVKTLIEVSRLMLTESIEVDGEQKAGTLKMYFAENQLLFIYDDIELVSRVIEGQYPDYKQIIPDVKPENKTVAKIGRREITQAVKACSLFSRANVNDIKLGLWQTDKKIVVSSANGQEGESVIEIITELSGKDNEITLNYKYLLDGLSNLDSEEVILEIVDSNTPVALKIEARTDWLYIIMPIKR